MLPGLMLCLALLSCAPRQPPEPAGPDPSDLASRAARLERVGEYSEAVSALDQALALVPNDAELVLARARVHLRRGDALRAEVDYSRAMELLPDDPWPHAGRGLARSLAGRHQGAVEDFSFVLEREPDNQTALLNRGFSRARLGEHVLAVEDFSRVVGKSGDELALYYRARSLAALDRPVQAARDYALLLEREPEAAAAALEELLGPGAVPLSTHVDQAVNEPDQGRLLPLLDCLARRVLDKPVAACSAALR